MTNVFVSIALLSPPSTGDACKELVAFGYEWGGWFIVASLPVCRVTGLTLGRRPGRHIA